MVCALALDNITFNRDGRNILDQVNLHVDSDQRWLIVGANGSGKTSLVRIAALYEHPTVGVVSVLGEILGTTDVRSLRRRIGYVSASFASELRPALSARDVVMTAKNAALETWWHDYDESDRKQAQKCLDQMNVGELWDRHFGTLSSGEQQRVLLARSLMNEPGIILLDEPSARLDLAGREQLVRVLQNLACDASSPPLVLVTHHVDEIPRGMTHVLFLKNGSVMTAGSMEESFNAANLSECFEMKLELVRRADQRFSAWATQA